ncbi:unnamed protein product [Parnassius mnemosyne]|uniref:F-box domain-containing protein n=1 Tax=Parnassius mnemosyne TaxID=213953 RepID=A0AAV1MB58_9NEOP
MDVETLEGDNIEDEDAEDSEDVGFASAWQRGDGVALAILRSVFSWLEGGSLVRAAGVCRAWRRAAAEPALWRRRLLPRAAPPHLRALRRAAVAAQLHTESSWSGWSWRREYWLTAARWRLQSRELAAGGACVTHAALSHAADRIAVTADDASFTVWERVAAGGGWRWARGWGGSLRARGWAAAGAARWAPGDARLLLAGPLALADRWELLVLRFDQNGRGMTEVRAECSSCGGCWASANTFVTLIPRLLAPARAVTTVWLNAAEQKLQSEYAGVTVPVLRIYNEAAAHITHMLIAEVPAEDLEKLEQKNSTTVASESVEEHTLEEGEDCPTPEYWQATLPVLNEVVAHVLVAAMGAVGGERGVARALGAWELRALALPPLFATASLAERVARRRSRAGPPSQDEPPPSEDELRALCTPPLVTCRLRNRVLGLQIHPNGGCVWASTCAGAECVSLPALRPLMRVTAAASAPVSSLPYVVQPAASDDYIAAPAGDGSWMVRVWAAR